MTKSNGGQPIVKTALQSVQERASAQDDAQAFLVPLFLTWLDAVDDLPPWWTPARDQKLREFWRSEGLLASTIYTMQAILSTVGWVVEGSDEKLVAQARQPLDDAEFGEGLKVTIKKLAEDWFTQDNGMFLEILGPGDPAGPLTSQPTGIAHLDAGRCWRSGDPEYPVWYLSQRTAKWHKLHWTRVAFAATNPSAIEAARGIGFSAVSRVAAFAGIMRDTVRYKGEKVGGRQTRALVTISGAPKEAVETALEEAEKAADNAGRVKFSAMPIIAAPTPGAQIKADMLEFAGVLDGFVWQDEITMYMFVLSLAFGIDARELWPSTSSGATKADAEVQHRKAMRKGVGDFLTTLEFIFNRRLMPEGVTHTFKPKDSEEDQAQADLEKTRIDAAQVMVDSGIVTVKGAVTYLVNAGVLPPEYLVQQDLAETEPVETRTPPTATGQPVAQDNVDSTTPGSGAPTAADETATAGKSLGARITEWMREALRPSPLAEAKKKAWAASAPPSARPSGVFTGGS